MALLLDIVHPLKSDYVDRKFKGTREQFFSALAKSTTLYVGNLSFFTTEEQIYELFSRAGDIKRIVMGLDAMKKTPCGFCFVVYYTRKDAQDAVHYLNGTLLDERNIRVDFDWGFEEGRQFGRGKGGGQVRDEYRHDYDEGRGGFGRLMGERMAQADLLLSVAGPAASGGAVYFGAGQRAWGGTPGSGGPRKRPRVREEEEEEEDEELGRRRGRPRGGVVVEGGDDDAPAAGRAASEQGEAGEGMVVAGSEVAGSEAVDGGDGAEAAEAGGDDAPSVAPAEDAGGVPDSAGEPQRQPDPGEGAAALS